MGNLFNKFFRCVCMWGVLEITFYSQCLSGGGAGNLKGFVHFGSINHPVLFSPFDNGNGLISERTSS